MFTEIIWDLRNTMLFWNILIIGNTVFGHVCHEHNLDPKYFKFFLIIAHVFQDYIKADDWELILMFSLLSKYIEFTTLLRVLIIYTSIKAHNFYISGLQKSYIIHGQILLTFQTNQHQTCKKDYFSFRNTVLGPVYHTKLDINRFKLAFYVFDMFNSYDQTPKFSCLCIF